MGVTPGDVVGSACGVMPGGAGRLVDLEEREPMLPSPDLADMALCCAACGQRHPLEELAWRCGACGEVLDLAGFTGFQPPRTPGGYNEMLTRR
jgi:hypothetical protein